MSLVSTSIGDGLTLNHERVKKVSAVKLQISSTDFQKIDVASSYVDQINLPEAGMPPQCPPVSVVRSKVRAEDTILQADELLKMDVSQPAWDYIEE
jgi:hypothetical protein